MTGEHLVHPPLGQGDQVLAADEHGREEGSGVCHAAIVQERLQPRHPSDDGRSHRRARVVWEDHLDDSIPIEGQSQAAAAGSRHERAQLGKVPRTQTARLRSRPGTPTRMPDLEGVRS